MAWENILHFLMHLRISIFSTTKVSQAFFANFQSWSSTVGSLLWKGSVILSMAGHPLGTLGKP